MEAHIYAMDQAAWIPLADLRYPDDLQRKVRVVGFCESYDIQSAKASLLHGGASLTVDLTLLVENGSLALPERCKLMCIGTLEPSHSSSDSTKEIAVQQGHHGPPGAIRSLACKAAADNQFVLMAIYAKTIDDLDLRLWTQAARAMRRSLPSQPP
ncbi:hypothetical protein MNAN1_003663 [Malassezia nana]|uniref:Uncharacterized protein n=1 Tax=Malassezia nana TaxID=180528 RepID=A0AAF0EM91_9BASI|nr:hypothetical protein MNAN1_003663 [Malassezia nana]